MPSLGDLGKHSKSPVHSNFHKVGNPSIKVPIALSVKEMPFTKSQFKKYYEVVENRGDKPELAYIDSISNKPKYLSIDIADKIAIFDLYSFII